MKEFREIERVVTARPTMEGAGVKLKRVFGFGETGAFDPFLLLDHFGSDDPDDYMAGFPWHPHRGIETVTYLLSGEVAHGDSLGNSGVIGPGDVQWMTAGSGIIHQEMPRRAERRLDGFQLWVNLPAARKMTGPRYRDVPAASIATARVEGAEIKVVSGQAAGARGPVADLWVETLYCDVRVEPAGTMVLPLGPRGLVYCYAGSGFVGGPGREKPLAAGSAALLGQGASLRARATGRIFCFLLIAGESLGEPVAWRGPIVMNTRAELDTAFREYQDGTFLKA